MQHRLVILLTMVSSVIYGQSESISSPALEDTLVGSNNPQKDWWDIQHYDISIKPDQLGKTIEGKNIIRFKVIRSRHSGIMQIDLVKPLVIDSVTRKGRPVPYRNRGNIWYLTLGQLTKGKLEEVSIYYSGEPVVSKSPPWDGGVIWTMDSLKRPWISVACQYKGASLWYPCKNMLYDEPDAGAAISITVPAGLTAISNGQLVQQISNSDGTVKFQWAVTNPINHYGVSFYIGAYTNIKRSYHGRQGVLSLDFWVLDYNGEKALSHLVPEVEQAMGSMEKCFGPYPFYADGFKIVDAPYIGMEHQSAIAYGNNYTKGTFKGNDVSRTGWGKKTDRIVIHEMAHEWFGNSITASDIADRWIQEGFAGLAEELVIADHWGKAAGEEFIAGRYRSIENDKPIIGRYGINEDGSSDGYIKGWAVLHMIKTIMNNDEKFLSMLRDMNRRFYHQVVSSRQIEDFINASSGVNCKPLFDQYLRTTQVPVLEYQFSEGLLKYRFVDCIKGFVMPVRVMNGKPTWISPTTEWRSIPFNQTADSLLTIDPNFYIKTRSLNLEAGSN